MTAVQPLLNSYQYGEGLTAIGRPVSFSCAPGKIERVAGFLRENVRTIEVPRTGTVKAPDGKKAAMPWFTRYDVIQHEYAGGGHPGGGGYIEALEIKDPPDGRWGIVINEYRSGYGHSSFTEWETLQQALDAYKNNWSGNPTEKIFPTLPGFKRRVAYGALTPWFYAIGDEQLIGDYAFPDCFQDDPVFRFGNTFVVFDDDGIPSIKTCMGTRFLDRKREYHPYDRYRARLVYWDDGSVWDENTHGGVPRPAQEGELWIAEAIDQFRAMLAGKQTSIRINFTDGNAFVGKLVQAGARDGCVEGDYFLKVSFKGGKKPKKGWINDFKPTTQWPDIVQYVTAKCAEGGEVVERIEIEDRKIKKGGKRWGGVFFARSRT